MIDQKEVLMENNFDIKEIIESRLPFWEDLSLSDRDLILSQITRQKFDKGMVVNRDFEGCQGAMILLSGQLRTYIVSEEGGKLPFTDLEQVKTVFCQLHVCLMQ